MDNAPLNSQYIGEFQREAVYSADVTEEIIILFFKEFYNMQKKIIALAVAAAFVVPAVSYAAADVYGIAHVSIDVVNDGMETSSSSSANQLNSNRSRVGLKGSEDLGNGLSADWQMEGTVGMDAGGFALDRNTYIGLNSADMGTVRLGRHDTPYKIATRGLDVFKDTQADNRDSGMLFGMDLRLNNVIAYISPDMSGLTVLAASTFDAESPSAAPNDKKATVLSASGIYNRDNINASLSIQNIKFGSSATYGTGSNLAGAGAAVDDETNAIKLGGGYMIDQFTLNAFVEMGKHKTAAVGATPSSEDKGTNVYVGGKFAVSDSDTVKLAYTLRGESETDGVKNADKASQVSVGYDHSMSANTSVYALYSKVTEDATGAADPSIVSLGVKHSF